MLQTYFLPNDLTGIHDLGDIELLWLALEGPRYDDRTTFASMKLFCRGCRRGITLFWHSEYFGNGVYGWISRT